MPGVCGGGGGGGGMGGVWGGGIKARPYRRVFEPALNDSRLFGTMHVYSVRWPCILVQVTIYRGLRIWYEIWLQTPPPPIYGH